MRENGKIRCAVLAFMTACALLWAPTQVRAAEPAAAAPAAEKSESNADTIARQHARKIIGGLTARAVGFGTAVDGAARSGPDWLSAPLPGGATPARWGVAAGLLALVALLTWQADRRIRAWAGRIGGGKEQTWPRMLLSAVRKPLGLTIWIYAIFFAVALIADPAGISPKVARILSGLTYAGLTIATFWLLMRVIRGTQHKLQKRADRTDGLLDSVLVPLVGTALRLLVPLVCLFILLGAVRLPPAFEWVGSKALAIVLIGCVAWLIVRAATISEKAVLRANRIDVSDNLRARQIYTQVSVIRKIVVTGVVFLAAACMLMLFQPVRQLGTSILASAGIAGVVLGFAAQKTLSNLFAGIQIAISQPIRIDDVVIVEGEWGRIEDITLTFVTVCIWDLRRLVLPINYFIEKPFQNWTRNSADLLNSVFIYADYTLPVEPLRQELKRLLDASPHWDKKAWVLQVTDSTPQTMEIRCLMSSGDAPTGWDLKCAIREGLVRFVQTNYPDSLPRVRTELHRDTPRPPHPEAAMESATSSSPGLEVA